MRERPIPFSAPMVRAILAGAKTQTRRIVKHHITGPNPPGGFYDWHDKRTGAWVGAHGGNLKFNKTNAAVLCPYGGPGDRLWVRETWHSSPHFDCLYRADYDDGARLAKVIAHGGWKSSIHMPRWASRITLEITDVRVERLQEISEADAIAEGIEPGSARDFWKLYGRGANGDMDRSPRVAYRSLWESIHGVGSWDANPWVWVVEFRRA